MTFEADSEIRTPQADAFDRMADARNEVHWNSQVKRSELLTAEPIGVGTEFETVNRGQPYRATVTTYDRPDRLVFDVSGKQMDITASFAFSTRGEVTALHSVFDFRPKGFVRFMFPLMKSLIARDLPKQAQSFARYCEAAADS